MSHVIELAADTEAIRMAAQLILAANDGQFSQQSLWLLICGLMCQFQRFHGDRDANPGPVPVGSHPVPAFRMRMALRELKNFALHPAIRSRAPWVTGPDIVQRLIDHASTTASIFWTITSDWDRGGIPPFYQQVHPSEPMLEAHSRMLLSAWLDIREDVKSHYFGWWTGELPFDPTTIEELS
jgi:hypothetical protein